MLRMKKQDMNQYIVSHLDQALEEGWIVPYFQPIIRTITGRFAASEALARWQDPVYGTLMPDTFVPVLEQNRLIYKVDCHILKKVVLLQRSRIDAGLPVGPVSVNLSRQDFDVVDMAACVRKTADAAQIRHDLIPLELTESVLVSDREKMKSIVRTLRADGFRIWMDDFGSGYSSLSFLNDYTLDLIKLDMGFLKSFSHVSMEIMQSTVSLAKKLGIRTLAEGVETEEHVQFLKEIGCDMMQGYYYARPMGSRDMTAYLDRMKLAAESVRWQAFYDCADACVISSDVPRALMEYDVTHDHIRYLFINSQEKEQLRSIGRRQSADSEFVLNAGNMSFHEKLLEFYSHIMHEDEQAVLYISDNAFFVRLEGKLVARQDDRCIFLISLVNVTQERTQKINEVLSKSASDILLLFDDIHVLDPEKDTADNLVNNFGIDGGLQNHDPLRRGLQDFCTEMVFREDQKRYAAFADADTMIERIRQTPDGVLRDYFRVLRSADENYVWKEFSLFLVPGSQETKVLSCIKSAEPSADADFLKKLWEKCGTEEKGGSLEKDKNDTTHIF